MTQNVLHSSQSDEWTTPPWLFTLLNQAYRFTYDACATDDNALCARYGTQQGRYSQSRGAWCHMRDVRRTDKVWMNPPYTNVSGWTEEAARVVRDGRVKSVVGLVPSRTDTAWWHDNVLARAEVIYIRGRLRFSGADNSAPFPSAIVIWGPRLDKLTGINAKQDETRYDQAKWQERMRARQR